MRVHRLSLKVGEWKGTKWSATAAALDSARRPRRPARLGRLGNAPDGGGWEASEEKAAASATAETLGRLWISDVKKKAHEASLPVSTSTRDDELSVARSSACSTASGSSAKGYSVACGGSLRRWLTSGSSHAGGRHGVGQR